MLLVVIRSNDVILNKLFLNALLQTVLGQVNITAVYRVFYAVIQNCPDAIFKPKKLYIAHGVP